MSDLKHLRGTSAGASDGPADSAIQKEHGNPAVGLCQEAWTGFSQSFYKSAVADPVESLDEIKRQCITHEKHRPRHHERQEPVEFGSARWHGQVWGSTLGGLVPFFLVSSVFSAGKLARTERLVDSLELISKERADYILASQAAPRFDMVGKGVATSLLFQPAGDGDKNYGVAKFENATATGITFGALELGASYSRIKRLQGNLTGQPWKIQSGLSSVGDYVGSGACAGVIQSEVQSLISDRRMTGPEETVATIIQGAYSGAILGGGIRGAGETAALALKGPRLSDVVAARPDWQMRLMKDPAAQELLLELGQERVPQAGVREYRHFYDLVADLKPEYKLDTIPNCEIVRAIGEGKKLDPSERLEKLYQEHKDPEIRKRMERHPMRLYELAMVRLGLLPERFVGIGYESMVLKSGGDKVLKLSYKPFHEEHGSRFFDEDVLLRSAIDPIGPFKRVLGKGNEFTVVGGLEKIQAASRSLVVCEPNMPVMRSGQKHTHVYLSVQPYGQPVVSDILAFKFGKNLLRHGWDFKDPTAGQLVYRDGMIRLVDSLSVAPLKENGEPRFLQRAISSMPSLAKHQQRCERDPNEHNCVN